MLSECSCLKSILDARSEDKYVVISLKHEKINCNEIFTTYNIFCGQAVFLIHTQLV